MRTGTNYFVCLLSLVFMGHFAAAQESKTSFITFSKDPLKVIRVDRSAENRIVFSQCDRAQASLGAVLSNCSAIGNPEGYTAEQLNGKARSQRRFNWLKNTLTIPAGAVCAAALTGAASFAVHYEQIILGVVGFTVGTMEMSTLGLVSPHHMNQGGRLMAGGLVQSALGMVTVYVHTLVGGAVGVPLSWKLTRSWFPKYRNGYHALKFAAETGEDNVVELEMKGKFASFEKGLTKLLAKIE